MRHTSLCDRLLSRCRGRLLLVALTAFAGVALLRASGLVATAAIAPAPNPVHATPAPVQLAHQSTTQYIWMEVTAYCPCKICCGRQAHGVTASGKSVRHNGGRFVAADTALLPFGTRVSVPGYHEGTPVPVIDTGGDINGHRLDVFFRTHAAAEEWGRQMLRVRVDPAG